jgi:hypothetical protein
MRGELSDRSIEDLRNTCTEAVAILTEKGYKARVGKSGRMTYPAVKKGVWTAALILDTGLGWACPLYDAINAPHWDWFLTTNMDMFNVAVASGLGWGLLGKGKSPEVVARTLEYILMDPCRLPNNNCSPNFECLECDLDWDTKISDMGIIGRAFNLEFSLYPEEGTFAPAGWNEVEAKILFGEKDYFDPVTAPLDSSTS